MTVIFSRNVDGLAMKSIIVVYLLHHISDLRPTVANEYLYWWFVCLSLKSYIFTNSFLFENMFRCFMVNNEMYILAKELSMNRNALCTLYHFFCAEKLLSILAVTLFFS